MKSPIKTLLNRIRISHRLIYIATMSISLYLVAAAIGWLGMEASSTSLKSVYEDRANPMQDLAAIDANIREDALKLLFAFEGAPGRPAAGLMDDSATSLTAEVRANTQRFRESWQRYLAIPHGEEEKLLAQAFVEKHRAWIKKIDKTIAEIEDRKLNNAEVLSEFLYAIKEERQYALDALHELIAFQAKVAKDEYETAEKRYRNSRYLLLGFLIVGGLAVCGPAILTIRHISRSLEAAGKTASAIAAGDLTVAIGTHQQDEIGDLMQKLSVMRGNLFELIVSIRENAVALNQQAIALSGAAESSAQTVENQSSAATSMALTITQLSELMDHIDQNAREAHTISQTSSDHATEGGQIIHRAAAEMERIADAVNISAGSIRELEELSRQISTIVQVIKDVADQTNLLALNAAIEAARAGEQGRGFAVVADEVRKLAERTSASTHEISSMISRIQEGTASAVKEMSDGVARVGNGVSLAKQAGQSVTEIRDAAQRTASVVAEITQVLTVQSKSSKEAAQRVVTIVCGIETNSASIAKTADSARHLADLSSEMARLAARFRVS